MSNISVISTHSTKAARNLNDASETTSTQVADAATPRLATRPTGQPAETLRSAAPSNTMSAAQAPAKVPQGDATRGARLFVQKCGMCHTVAPETNKTGPSLFNVFNRTAGAAPGYSYSRGMKKSEHNWTQKNLDAFLKNPKDVVPGTKMQVRVPKKSDRQDLIAYLRENVAKQPAQNESHGESK